MSQQGEAIIAAVRQVADQAPFYVYEGACVYVRGGCPGCLIGQALWKLGLIDASLEQSHLNNEPVWEILGRLLTGVDRDEMAWLERAQTAQDQGCAWESVVRQADEAR